MAGNRITRQLRRVPGTPRNWWRHHDLYRTTSSTCLCRHQTWRYPSERTLPSAPSCLWSRRHFCRIPRIRLSLPPSCSRRRRNNDRLGYTIRHLNKRCVYVYVCLCVCAWVCLWKRVNVRGRIMFISGCSAFFLQITWPWLCDVVPYYLLYNMLYCTALHFTGLHCIVLHRVEFDCVALYLSLLT